ncbi:MAG TPA: CbtA family protein [Pilimelia sp.]|nr:CbtA family protein [Pilimelia sp.]
MTAPSYRWLLGRGLLAGAAAGLTGGVVGLLVVEPVIRAALEVEEARAAAAGDAHHEELFSRPVQVFGGVAAAILVGLALGAVFATVLAATVDRRPDRPFARSLYAAAVGFAAVGLLPAIKYPANPPGVGDPATVNQRTLSYLTLIAAGLALAYGAGRLDAVLSARTGWSQPSRTTAVTAAVVTAVALILLVWPATPDTVPADIPADLLWRFRLASLAELAAIWAVLGFTFGLLTQRRATVPAASAPATA